jgi:lysophospholipase L1-like esterase
MEDRKIKLTFFGDSICVGQGVSIYRSWINRIAESVDKFVGNYDFDVLVTNSSVNGRTTRQALEDMPYHIQNSGVDILVVQFGLNDCNYWQSDRGVPRVSKDAYIANLEEIYCRGKKFGAKAVILNTNHPTTKSVIKMAHTDISYEESNDMYGDALRNKFSQYSNDLILVDVNKEFKSKCSTNSILAEMLLADELHLSEKGHNEYYSIIYPIILKNIINIAKAKGWLDGDLTIS